ncbi:hypothetical protein COCC4DRAFT_198289 [Bipolaris maydis ATCC 48331]|uniref:Uncharacterized protein n=2 Tax=Cochliobolus heterostrophus TaxID=5016 RepID=M2VBI2_COCH5|nr:uncharacterized protein COCC4DRAFT_198289 [Bipolaris maydis ATCC 48331]EMD97053.1 hypothetical protein COCHEDRAFT_1208926 [Bipolaris maydis C5]ENI04481.1 hypothetical protein COCC4DRAFT_198289 [Bipolaris maydis ATCC 48331]KAH7551561.1 hypothetical protein BM1_09877 [Bipolaris maydis]
MSPLTAEPARSPLPLRPDCTKDPAVPYRPTDYVSTASRRPIAAKQAPVYPCNTGLGNTPQIASIHGRACGFLLAIACISSNKHIPSPPRPTIEAPESSAKRWWLTASCKDNDKVYLVIKHVPAISIRMRRQIILHI